MPVLYTKSGSRYKAATLAQLVGGLVEYLVNSGHTSLARDILERTIAALDTSRASTVDVKLITQHVAEQLRRDS